MEQKISCEKPNSWFHSSEVFDAITASVEYLNSAEARESLLSDAYWPKWNSPWWHVTLLFEMGMLDRVPDSVISALLGRAKTQYLSWFPFRESELPSGIDPFRNVICHCALGTLYKIFFARGIDVENELPWARRWFLKYQLPDGGLNCDEAAYLKESPKSSIVSTLPPLEAVLGCTSRDFTIEETGFLENGANYLLSHRLFRSATELRKILNLEWQKVCFPRFYEYDILRGLSFLARWSVRFGVRVPRADIEEAWMLISEQFDSTDQVPVVGNSYHLTRGTLKLDPEGKWSKGHPVSTFPLLECVRKPGTAAPWLSEELSDVRRLFIDTRSL